ncbi:MAG: hypothetical protein FD145_435 [Candidatus Saganbacteria bacterium]|uniref:Uncharacterized protein n=1 Tax=Candidatus Saganbacteria bacterium TaxID=2575572 RepID=A0A833L4F8_UNCSA|nr:MAG: hypothetical protein FD145_435 [Candidatus Saganbacteria bacterium]
MSEDLKCGCVQFTKITVTPANSGKVKSVINNEIKIIDDLIKLVSMGEKIEVLKKILGRDPNDKIRNYFFTEAYKILAKGKLSASGYEAAIDKIVDKIIADALAKGIITASQKDKVKLDLIYALKQDGVKKTLTRTKEVIAPEASLSGWANNIAEYAAYTKEGNELWDKTVDEYTAIKKTLTRETIAKFATFAVGKKRKDTVAFLITETGKAETSLERGLRPETKTKIEAIKKVRCDAHGAGCSDVKVEKLTSGALVCVQEALKKLLVEQKAYTLDPKVQKQIKPSSLVAYRADKNLHSDSAFGINMHNGRIRLEGNFSGGIVLNIGDYNTRSIGSFDFLPTGQASISQTNQVFSVEGRLGNYRLGGGVFGVPFEGNLGLGPINASARKHEVGGHFYGYGVNRSYAPDFYLGGKYVAYTSDTPRFPNPNYLGVDVNLQYAQSFYNYSNTSWKYFIASSFRYGEERGYVPDPKYVFVEKGYLSGSFLGEGGLQLSVDNVGIPWLAYLGGGTSIPMQEERSDALSRQTQFNLYPGGTIFGGFIIQDPNVGIFSFDARYTGSPFGQQLNASIAYERPNTGPLTPFADVTYNWEQTPYFDNHKLLFGGGVKDWSWKFLSLRMSLNAGLQVYNSTPGFVGLLNITGTIGSPRVPQSGGHYQQITTLVPSARPLEYTWLRRRGNDGMVPSTIEIDAHRTAAYASAFKMGALTDYELISIPANLEQDAKSADATFYGYTPAEGESVTIGDVAPVGFFVGNVGNAASASTLTNATVQERRPVSKSEIIKIFGSVAVLWKQFLEDPAKHEEENLIFKASNIENEVKEKITDTAKQKAFLDILKQAQIKVNPMQRYLAHIYSISHDKLNVLRIGYARHIMKKNGVAVKQSTEGTRTAEKLIAAVNILITVENNSAGVDYKKLKAELEAKVVGEETMKFAKNLLKKIGVKLGSNVAVKVDALNAISKALVDVILTYAYSTTSKTKEDEKIKLPTLPQFELMLG